MTRRFRVTQTAASIVDCKTDFNVQKSRYFTLQACFQSLVIGAFLCLLFISTAQAIHSFPGVKGTFDDQLNEKLEPGESSELEQERTEEQIAFDDLVYGIETGTIPLETQQDFDEQLEKLNSLVPEGDEDRRLNNAYYQCRFKHMFEPRKGIETANKMISNAKARKDRVEEGVLTMCLANYYDAAGLTSETLMTVEKAIDIGKEINDNYLLADAYTSRCGIRSLLGENDFALRDCIKAEELYKAEGVIDASEGLIFDIGIIYRRLGFLDRAEKYLLRSEEIAKEENLLFGEVRVHLQLGFLEEQRGNYELAIERYLKALKVAEDNKIIAELVPVRIALAGGYNLNGEYGKALKELRQADEISTEINNLGYDGMSAMQYGIALSHMEQPEQAEQHFQQAEKAMLQDNNRRYLSWLYQAWADSHKRAGNSDRALELYQKYMDIHEMLELQRSDQQTQVLRFEYDSEKTELENKRLQQQQQLKDEQLKSLEAARKWQILAIILGGLLTVVLIWFSMRQVANSRKFKQLAYTDSLTGLANRRQIERALKQAMENANESEKPLSILMYDIDHFKIINDRHGHSVGDVVLTNLSNFSKELLRDNDVLGRTGGEEFLAILPNANLDQAIQVAKRLQREVDLKQYTDIESDLNATISVGVTEFKFGENMDQLLHRVDEALYQAKENGRNRVEYVI